MANRLDTSNEATHERWVQHVEAFERFVQRGGRAEAVRCRDYFDGRQWTADEIQKLEEAGQPVITDNRIKPKVMFILGVEEQQRSDPKAFPREDSDDGGADIASKVLQAVGDSVNSDQRLSQGFEYLNVEGIEAHVILANGADVVHTEIPYHRYLFDPHAQHRFFDDKKWDGIAAWMDIDDILTLWPNASPELLDEANYVSNTYLDDRPNNITWCDPVRERFRVIQLYVRERGVWRTGIFTGAGWLEEPTTSPWLDADGNPSNPIVSGSAFIDASNERYSVIRDMISLQDEINKRRSKALHWADSRQLGVQGPTSRAEIEAIREEAHKADGVLHAKDPSTKINVLDNPSITETQLKFMQLAIDSIDASGPNSSLSGKDDSLRSGRAIRANQTGGLLELNRVFDTHQEIKRRVYNKYWERVKQAWTDEKVIRVIEGAERQPKFFKVNEKVSLETAIQRKYNGIPEALEASVEFQLRRNDPVILNNIGKIDADIIIEPVPDTVNMQEELFAVLGQALQYMPPERAAIAADIMLENMPIPDKQRVMDRLRGNDQDPVAQAAAQRQQQINDEAINLQFQKARAEITDIQASAAKKVADARNAVADAVAKRLSPPSTMPGASAA